VEIVKYEPVSTVGFIRLPVSSCKTDTRSTR